MKAFLFENSEPLTEEAVALVKQAMAEMEQRFLHGFHQLVALGLGEEGRNCMGVQQDVPIGQASTCAEVLVISKAGERKMDLKILVTVHHRRQDQQGEKVHVVPPCGLCRERLLHFFPNCRVIIWLNGELRLVPIYMLLPLPYKTKKPGQNGGHATSVHDY